MRCVHYDASKMSCDYKAKEHGIDFYPQDAFGTCDNWKKITGKAMADKLLLKISIGID